MFRSIQRLAVLSNTRILSRGEFLHKKSALRAFSSLNTLQPASFNLKRQGAIFNYGFHTLSPCFEQEQKISKEEEEAIDPNHKMLIGFTCKVCQDRSHHVMSKHSYTKGVVLIQCPGCKNRHLIADNLGWFRDSKTTIEDLVKEKGEAIRHVVVDEAGVEKMGDLMEWLPEIAHEEKVKKAEAKIKADELKESQKEE
ncbi:hypothetical protein INT47_001270 [Mucor saturninus]|uniref:DNL-type domain-containing protein n=1 Tax=Mucor saturninus TaxID=64648 RepID=A0A8H7VGU4_9FUNG|nr:hypothetical protein INT47_001270 [Mucor saturninus]